MKIQVRTTALLALCSLTAACNDHSLTAIPVAAEAPVARLRVTVANPADGGVLYWTGKLFGFAALMLIAALLVTAFSVYAYVSVNLFSSSGLPPTRMVSSSWWCRAVRVPATRTARSSRWASSSSRSRARTSSSMSVSSSTTPPCAPAIR
jgi:hypothetical protein